MNKVKIFSANTAEELEEKINSFFSKMEEKDNSFFQVNSIHYQIDADAEYFSVLIYYMSGKMRIN